MIKKTVLFSLVFSLLAFSCTKSSKYEFVSERDFSTFDFNKPGVFHKWYSFTSDGFIQVERCDLAPVVNNEAWTEAIRLSSANVCFNNELEGYAIINHLGIMHFKGDQVLLKRDSNIFGQRTAGNLFFVDKIPFFTVCKNLFFNQTINQISLSSINHTKNSNQDKNLFILQYEPKNKVFYPVLNIENITKNFFLPENSQIVEVHCINDIFYVCVKYIQDEKVLFKYLTFRTLSSISVMTPSLQDDIFVSEIEEQEFKRMTGYKDFEYAPESIKKLLNDSVLTKPFFLELKQEGGSFGTKFYSKSLNVLEKEKDARAIITKNFASLLFEDGTFYIQGSLIGSEVINEGEVLALRLPKLPKGFKYTDYVITNNLLYAGWEENDFYKTIRSGFIAVNLEKLVY